MLLLNKQDRWDTTSLAGQLKDRWATVSLSARSGEGIEELQRLLVGSAGEVPTDDTLIVSNIRHYDALIQASEALERATVGLANDLPSDLVSEEIRQVLHHLGTITGEITTDDILGHIFSKFCIGK